MPEVPSQTKGTGTGTSVAEATQFQDSRTLEEALILLTRYGNEYMDENPLVGEPGSFILSKSSESSSSTRQASKTNLGRAAPTGNVRVVGSAEAPSPGARASIPIQPPDNKEKLKRRKSKVDTAAS
jgi:mediator of RNA polymerase II transcription subunit 6